jgi:hypothetical protein
MTVTTNDYQDRVKQPCRFGSGHADRQAAGTGGQQAGKAPERSGVAAGCQR